MLIAFDLDDTIIDTSGSVTQYKMEEFLRFLMQRQVCIGLFDQALQQLQEIDRRSASSKESVRLMLESCSASHLFHEAMAIYTEPLPKNFMIPTTPNAKNVLHILSEWGHTLTLVTGGAKLFQFEKLEKAGLEPSLFSKIDVSEDSKKKPYYEALLNEFSKLPSECFAVGDRILMDLAPAHELGWNTVHMRWGRGKELKKEKWVDHSICELTGLLEIL